MTYLSDMRHSEDTLQNSCVAWFDLQYRHISWALFHVPNGGQRNAKEAAKLKGMGVRPGVPDLILILPRGGYHYLAIELKVGKNKQTENQKWYQTKMTENGGRYAVIRTIDEFIQTVNSYLYPGG